jgi:hypothetical protein
MRQILQILQKQYLWYCAASRKFSNFSQNELLAKMYLLEWSSKWSFKIEVPVFWERGIKAGFIYFC